MMMNLFSVFDPSSSLSWSLNWVSSFYIIIFIPNMFWLIPSRWAMFYFMLMKFLAYEFKIY